MFYEWFIDNFSLLEVDMKLPISEWPITCATKTCFVEYYARIID